MTWAIARSGEGTPGITPAASSPTANAAPTATTPATAAAAVEGPGRCGALMDAAAGSVVRRDRDAEQLDEPLTVDVHPDLGVRLAARHVAEVDDGPAASEFACHLHHYVRADRLDQPGVGEMSHGHRIVDRAAVP